MAMKFGMAERRNLLMITLAVLGLQQLPMVGPLIMKLTTFSIMGYVTIGQIFGIVAVGLLYLTYKRRI